MKFETEFIEEMVRKYGSRKALIVLAGMGAIYTMPLPELLEPILMAYIVLAKVAGCALLGVFGVWAQLKLDKQEEPITE